MTITAQIIADSISLAGIRLTTMQLRYPRFIHAELMTHRAFSRNASSSRAIPVARLIEDVERDPAMPIHWGKNQPGMQAREELDELGRTTAEQRWRISARSAIDHARWMADTGAHKQIVNRILEPFAHINVLVTATEWDNFYELRRHEDAQPEIKALADTMWESQQASRMVQLRPEEWHLPYVTPEDVFSAVNMLKSGRITQDDPWDMQASKVLRKISVARCARVSYLTHEGKTPDIEKDLKLYEDLVGARPLHASPAEHQATPDTQTAQTWDGWANSKLHGNFAGWIQNRRIIEREIAA